MEIDGLILWQLFILAVLSKPDNVINTAKVKVKVYLSLVIFLPLSNLTVLLATSEEQKYTSSLHCYPRTITRYWLLSYQYVDECSLVFNFCSLTFAVFFFFFFFRNLFKPGNSMPHQPTFPWHNFGLFFRLFLPSFHVNMKQGVDGLWQ